MTQTLFQIGEDLSEDFPNICSRTMKTNRFDIYTMSQNSNVTIQHSQRRGPSEQIGERTYVAGIAYDSFDVWVDKGKQQNGAYLKTCVAENVRNFTEALQFAKVFI